MTCRQSVAHFVFGRPRSPWLRVLRFVPAVMLMVAIFRVSTSREPPGRALAETVLGPSLSTNRDLHFLLYAVLAVAMIWGLWPNLRSYWWSFIAGWFLTSVYGVIDECNQLFVPERTADFRDVIADSLGALVACVLVCGVFLMRRRKQIKPAGVPRPVDANDGSGNSLGM